MKLRNIAVLTLLGISVGLVFGGCQKKQGNTPPSSNKAAASEQMSPEMQTFYNSLSSAGQRKFMQLDDQHRAMAMDMVQQQPQGSGGVTFSDPNKAVDIQYTQQMQNPSMQGASSNFSPSTTPGTPLSTDTPGNMPQSGSMEKMGYSGNAYYNMGNYNNGNSNYNGYYNNGYGTSNGYYNGYYNRNNNYNGSYNYNGNYQNRRYNNQSRYTNRYSRARYSSQRANVRTSRARCSYSR